MGRWNFWRFWSTKPAPKPWSNAAEKFLMLVVRSGLVAEPDLANACAGCDADRTAPNALDELCDYLIAKSVLTQWQCDKL
jgi:hypothetical protein